MIQWVNKEISAGINEITREVSGVMVYILILEWEAQEQCFYVLW